MVDLTCGVRTAAQEAWASFLACRSRAESALGLQPHSSCLRGIVSHTAMDSIEFLTCGIRCHHSMLDAPLYACFRP
jgi:hypothetical protein